MMKEYDNGLERLLKEASQQDRMLPELSAKIEDEVIRAWRNVSDRKQEWAQNLSLSFAGACTVALACVIIWAATIQLSPKEGPDFIDSIDDLISNQL
jgi:hypothetical protein